MQLPGRVWVVGPCGSGKSTLARELAARLAVEPVHLDDVHFLPGWVGRSDEAMLRDLEPRLAGPRFVVDGNYGRIRRRFQDRVELTVWLDLPFALTFSRLVRRTARRWLLGETCCNGNRERLRVTLTSRESVLWWAITTHRRRRRELAADLAGRPHLRLRRPAEVASFLGSLAMPG